MSQKSAIEWTEDTWNCLAGCTEISPGCLHCYAAIMAHRLSAMAQKDIADGKDPGHKRKYIGTTKKLPSGKIAWTGKVNPDEEALTIPLRKKAPTTYFVNSMSDLFHEDVPDEFIARVYAVMMDTPRHTYQVLTKRAERMSAILNSKRFWKCVRRWLKGNHLQLCDDAQSIDDSIATPANVWQGVSVENRKHGLPRIEHLLRTPAAVRFLSVEPLLEDLGDIKPWLGEVGVCNKCGFVGPPRRDALGGNRKCGRDSCNYIVPTHSLIDWVIVGGESGHGARPMHPGWVRSIRDQCQYASVPFFFKQWGGWRCVDEMPGKAFVTGDGSKQRIIDHNGVAAFMEHVGKKDAGRLLDGREWNEMPKVQVPA